MGVAAGIHSYWPFGAALLVWGTSIPFVYNPAMSIAMSAPPPGRRGGASGLLEMCLQVGGTLGTALVGATLLHAHSGAAPLPGDAFATGLYLTAGVLAAAAVILTFWSPPRARRGGHHFAMSPRGAPPMPAPARRRPREPTTWEPAPGAAGITRPSPTAPEAH
ncbi:hypothetical protein [Streptomyces sp. NPDC002889]|uniref:hypothetical protein n=1 Tax=Streptomyces sp. NPDC002889 TaxID=3364669 RepID=UPI0036C39C54